MGKIKRLWFRIWLWSKVKIYLILVVNIIVMIAIIFAMVWVWFLLAPKEANLNFEGEVEKVEIEAASLWGSFDTYRLNFIINEGEAIDFSSPIKVEYSGKTYDNVSQLCVFSNLTDTYHYIHIRGVDTDLFYLNLSTFESVKCSISGLISCTGSEKLSVSFVIEDKVILNSDVSFVTAKDENGAELFTAAEKEELILVFENYPWLEISNKSTVEFFPESAKESFWNRATFSNVNSVKYTSTGAGKVNFSLGAQPTSYDINSQTVTASGVGLEATINCSKEQKGYKNNLTLNGMVNKATISGVSLFPDFWGWYRDNIYFAPLSLVTVVFGAVSMMKKTKKEK